MIHPRSSEPSFQAPEFMKFDPQAGGFNLSTFGSSRCSCSEGALRDLAVYGAGRRPPGPSCRWWTVLEGASAHISRTGSFSSCVATWPRLGPQLRIRIVHVWERPFEPNQHCGQQLPRISDDGEVD